MFSWFMHADKVASSSVKSDTNKGFISEWGSDLWKQWKQHAHPNAKRQPFIPEMVGPESISLISEHCVSNFFPFISVDGRFFTISQTDLTQEDVKCAFNPSREWIVSPSLWTDCFESIFFISNQWSRTQNFCSLIHVTKLHHTFHNK